MGYSFDRFLVFDYLLFLDDEMLSMTTQRIDKKDLSGKCIACGQLTTSGSFCHYCQEMREDLRCWPKTMSFIFPKKK
jgi:hypothetical protein